MEQAARHAVAYRRTIAAAETTPTATYAAMLAAFAGPTPEHCPAMPQAIIEELVERATPGIRASTGSRFFGWVIGNSHPTGVAADWLAAAWGQNAGNLLAAPASSAVEAVSADWLLDLLGLPAELRSGSSPARPSPISPALPPRAASAAPGRLGCRGRRTVRRAAGRGADRRRRACHRLFRPQISRLRREARHYDRDRRHGADAPGRVRGALRAATGPIIAIAQAGQINTGASDPFAAIVPAAHDAGAWVHVDGAFGLWAQAAPARQAQVAGVEQADSWGTDGHKWLQTPYDCGFAIVRDADAHRRAMAISASYLPPAAGAERDPSAYVPELSRRARGFGTWAMIRQLGRAGIAELVERNCAVAAAMGEQLAAARGVALVCPVVLNQFMVRFGDDDELTLAVVERVQADAVAFIGSSLWRGQWVMRVSVSSAATGFADGAVAVAAVLDAWRAVSGR
jgi:glutamate/tyrosine decarboxylase-like PLP-dependent enzyme